MTEVEVLDLMKQSGAIITGSHIIYTSGRHGEMYVNKDALYPKTKVASRLCESIASHFAKSGVEIVVAPAIGGVILSQWTAHHLSILTGKEVLGVYAEKSPTGDGFVLKRGYDKLVSGRKVLVVEDILTTGGSVKKVVELVRSIGGDVVGIGALCNRGGLKSSDVGEVPDFHPLVNLSLASWEGEACPLCRSGVPVNTELGKGKK